MRYKAPAQLLTKYRSRFSRRSGLGSGSLLLDMYRTDAAAAYALVDLGNKRGAVTETGESVFYEEYPIIGAGLNDGDFEDGTLTNNWQLTQLGSSTVTQEPTEVDTGSGAVKFTLDGSGSLAAINNSGYGSITAGEEVEWSFRAKRTAGLDYLAVGIANSSEGGNTSTISSEWQTFSGSFTASNTGLFSIKRSQARANTVMYIDNVQVKILNKTVTEDVTYVNPVVRVRRDSDGIFKSFPASQVKNGQMAAWVNQDVQIVSTSLNNGGFETAGGGGADVFASWSEAVAGTSTVNRDTSDFDTGTASCRLDIDASNSNAQVALTSVLSNGMTISYSIRAKGSNSGDRLSIGGTLTGDNDAVAITTEWATYTGTVTIVNGSTTFAIKRLDAASQSLWIDSVEVTITQANGVVSTLYDQSGSGNDATQSTVASMPKIVSAGALVTDANGNAALDFDGTDDKLDTPSLITSIGTAASFVIGQTVSSGGQIPLSLSTGTIRWFAPYDNGSRFDFSYAAAVNAITGANRDDNLHLWTMTAGSGGVEAFQDGVSQGTTAQSTGFTDVGDDEIMGNIICEGKITAILAYSADKSASRSAIESALSKVITTALS